MFSLNLRFLAGTVTNFSEYFLNFTISFVVVKIERITDQCHIAEKCMETGSHAHVRRHQLTPRRKLNEEVYLFLNVKSKYNSLSFHGSGAKKILRTNGMQEKTYSHLYRVFSKLRRFF
jgi:hypothetical protein